MHINFNSYDEHLAISNNLDVLSQLLQGFAVCSFNKDAAFSFFFNTIQHCGTWFSDLSSDRLSISDKYYSVIMPVRLSSAILISIVARDSTLLVTSGFSKNMADMLNLCAKTGLNYMKEDDLQKTISAFKYAGVWGFIKKHGNLSKSFTAFIESNSSIFAHLEE